MANYTPNYGLHQWEPGDDFLRTDFNADFAKLDAALEAKADKTAVAQKADQSALAAVQNLAEGRCRVVTGSYVGNGGTQLITVNLGGRPKAVIFPHDSVSSVIVSGNNLHAISITNSGFTVGNPNYMDSFQSNKEGVRQWYVALM